MINNNPDVHYPFGPDHDFNIGTMVPVANFDQWMLMQLLTHAVCEIQEGSNISMYKKYDAPKEEKYNYNNVWHLYQDDGTERTVWHLTLEGKEVFTLQEHSEFDYVVNYIDYRYDEEVMKLFFQAAAKHKNRFNISDEE